MFTKADFCRDYKVLAHGRVSLKGSGIVADAILIEFPDGDTAWASRTRVEWPDRVIVHEMAPRPGAKISMEDTTQ